MRFNDNYVNLGSKFQYINLNIESTQYLKLIDYHCKTNNAVANIFINE